MAYTTKSIRDVLPLVLPDILPIVLPAVLPTEPPTTWISILKGERGDPGYTPIKGIDYFDGTPGTPGIAGTNGYTPIKEVDYFDGVKGDKGDQGVPGSDANVTKSAVETVLIGEILTHSHPGAGGGLTQQQMEGMI